MITVIIPALNEEETIGQVVRLAWQSGRVSEVIVVDDMSMDATIAEARAAGATIVTSTKLGKGTSMADGVMVAKNDIIAFLDADIVTYPDNVVDLLTEAIINDEADFVKSFFDRQAGRVTELVAKPLLSILYPSFPVFRQPLSGMIAGKRSFFDRCVFEEGYGVDIAILIDMYNLGARIREVCIGKIENRMRPLEQLGKMSREVAGTIIRKSRAGDLQNLETYEDIQVIRGQMEFAIRESLMSLKKIAVFELDYAAAGGDFITLAGERFGFGEELRQVTGSNGSAFVRIKQIARLLNGRSFGEMIGIADEMELPAHLPELLGAMKELGYITGIISDGFSCISNHFKNKFGFDFSIANELEFSRSVATGEVRIPSFFLPGDGSICRHDYCKTNALASICRQYEVDIRNTVFIGGKDSDACPLEHAGIGIAFCSGLAKPESAAGYIIKARDYQMLVPVIN
ncbi:glycosyltransferase [Chitinophaga rhizosphaerae]|uniref:glycosyltransferase n=1 Tax=Chitinophaga rhizosphaerae TaxID=1864947 RepID=UPI000F80DEEE|nr:glycosyltransferase [Chitinophaga rhizosphaerae]